MNIKRTIGAGVTSLGLVVGLAGFAGATSGSNTTTGPDSYNVVKQKIRSRLEVNNHNNVHVSNTNHQTASTGDAEATHNTTAGDAMSGNAGNDNSLHGSVSVSNSGAGSAAAAAMNMPQSSSFTGSNTNTGPDSTNIVKSSTSTNVEVNNHNDISVSNSNTQSAYSGDATVSHNTTGGSAVTGDATNSNSTTLDLSVSN